MKVINITHKVDAQFERDKKQVIESFLDQMRDCGWAIMIIDGDVYTIDRTPEQAVASLEMAKAVEIQEALNDNLRDEMWGDEDE